jgi:hypothetical protein
LKITDADNKQTLIANVYAPLGYNNEKNEFFNNILDVIANYVGEDIILGGDFNITLTNSESLRRQRTEAEKRIAENVNIKIHENDLVDAWAGHNGYTWMRGKTQSRLDRIYTRLSQYTNKKLDINWTLTKSNHAAVILTLEHKERTNTKSEHIKLDNTIVTNTELLNELKKYLEEQMIQAANMNPHMKLEFAKMTIRTKAIEISLRLRMKENSELRDLNDQICQNSDLLKRYTDQNSLNIITRELEKCKQERDMKLQRQRRKLVNESKTQMV